MVDAVFQATTRELDPSEIEESAYLYSRSDSPTLQNILPTRPSQSFQRKARFYSRSRGRDSSEAPKRRRPSLPETLDRERGRSIWRWTQQAPQQSNRSRGAMQRASSVMSTTVTERGVEHSRPRMQGALPESTLDAPMMAGSDTPVFVTKLQIAWSNCVKTVTSLPFRKTRQGAKNTPPIPVVVKQAKAPEEKNNGSQGGREWMAQMFSWYGKSGEKQNIEKKRKKSQEIRPTSSGGGASLSASKGKDRSAPDDATSDLNDSAQQLLQINASADQDCASPFPVHGVQQQAIYDFIAHSSNEGLSGVKATSSSTTIVGISSAPAASESILQSSVSVFISKDGQPDTLLSISASKGPEQNKHVHFRGDRQRDEKGMTVTTRPICQPQMPETKDGQIPERKEFEEVDNWVARWLASYSKSEGEGPSTTQIPTQSVPAFESNDEDNWVRRWLESFNR